MNARASGNASEPDDVKRMRKIGRLARFGCLSVVLMLACMILYVNVMPAGPVRAVENFFEFNRIRAELKTAEERWQAQHISNYEINVTGFAPACIYSEIASTAPTTLVVQNDTLVQAYVMKNGVQKELPFVGAGCSLKRLTVLERFKAVEQSLEQTSLWADYLHVQFDPNLRFVTGHESGAYTPVSSCCSYFRFSNLRPIEGK